MQLGSPFSSLGSLGAQLGGFFSPSVTSVGVSEFIDLVGSLQTIVNLAGSYQTIVDAVGSYQPTIDVVGEFSDGS